MTEEIKQTADVTAAAVGALTFFDWISPIAGLFTICWLAIRIWETDTIKGFRKKLKKEK